MPMLVTVSLQRGRVTRGIPQAITKIFVARRRRSIGFAMPDPAVPLSSNANAWQQLLRPLIVAAGRRFGRMR
jgi:hypothetical protein